MSINDLPQDSQVRPSRNLLQSIALPRTSACRDTNLRTPGKCAMQRSMVWAAMGCIVLLGCGKKSSLTTEPNAREARTVYSVTVLPSSEAARLIAEARVDYPAVAIDTWLKSQGFTEMDTTGAVAAKFDTNIGRGEGVQLPYWNSETQQHAIASRYVNNRGQVWGLEIQWVQDGELVGEGFLWTPKGLIPIQSTADAGLAAKAPTRVVKLFQSYLLCEGGALLGSALAGLPCGEGYPACAGAAAIGTSFMCGWNFWTSWIFN